MSTIIILDQTAGWASEVETNGEMDGEWSGFESGEGTSVYSSTRGNGSFRGIKTDQDVYLIDQNPDSSHSTNDKSIPVIGLLGTYNSNQIYQFTKGDVVDEFWNAVEKLKDGEITSEPVKSTYGYHVIIRVSYTDKKALKDIKDELVDEMISAKLSEDSSLYTKTWVKIRNKYNLELNDTTIKAKYEQTTNKSE